MVHQQLGDVGQRGSLRAQRRGAYVVRHLRVGQRGRRGLRVGVGVGSRGFRFFRGGHVGFRGGGFGVAGQVRRGGVLYRRGRGIVRGNLRGLLRGIGILRRLGDILIIRRGGILGGHVILRRHIILVGNGILRRHGIVERHVHIVRQGVGGRLHIVRDEGGRVLGLGDGQFRIVAEVHLAGFDGRVHFFRGDDDFDLILLKFRFRHSGK